MIVQTTAWRRARRSSNAMTLDTYLQLEQAGAIVRPLTGGTMRSAAPLSPAAAPAATKTSSAERALLRGAA